MESNYSQNVQNNKSTIEKLAENRERSMQDRQVLADTAAKEFIKIFEALSRDAREAMLDVVLPEKNHAMLRLDLRNFKKNINTTKEENKFSKTLMFNNAADNLKYQILKTENDDIISFIFGDKNPKLVSQFLENTKSIKDINNELRTLETKSNRY